MVPFAGYLMPVQYEGVNAEHEIVRKDVGVFDVSHMGEFLLKGPNALDLIQRVTSNDASKLFDGRAQYTCLPNETGGIVDDLLVYRISEEEYLLVVNASNIEKDWNWISKYNTEGVVMENISDGIALLAVQGPKATAALQKLTDVNLSEVKYYHFSKGTFAGVDNVILSATGYTGSGGFELYIPNAVAEEVWKKVFEAGEEFGIKPIGLAARDTLRLEMGYCLYGNDISDTTSIDDRRPVATHARMTITHLSPTFSTNIDIYVLPPERDVSNSFPLINGMDRNTTFSGELSPGTYNVSITTAGTNDTLVGPTRIDLEKASYYTLVIADSDGGGAPITLQFFDDF